MLRGMFVCARAGFVLLLLWSSPLVAQDAEEGSDYEALAQLEGATEEAEMRFNLGQRYYQTGRFEAAAREFSASYALTGLAPLLYNMFLAYRESGDLDAAISALERFVVQLDDGPMKANATARLEGTRRLRARMQNGAGEEESEAGAEAEAETNVPAQESAQEPDVPENSRRDDASPDLATEPSEYQPAEEPGLSPAPWIVASAGGALVLASIVPGVMALGDDASLDELCEGGSCTGNYEDLQDRGRRRAITSDILLFGGLAIGTAGLLWGLLRPRSPVQPSASCQTTGCALLIQGRM